MTANLPNPSQPTNSMGRLHRDFLSSIASFLIGHPENIPALLAMEGCCTAWSKFMTSHWGAVCESTFGQGVNFNDVAAAYAQAFGHAMATTTDFPFLKQMIQNQSQAHEANHQDEEAQAQTQASASEILIINTNAKISTAQAGTAAEAAALPGTAAPLRPVPTAALAVAASSSNFRSNFTSSIYDAGEGVRRASSAPLAGSAFWKGLTLRLFNSFALVSLTRWEDDLSPAVAVLVRRHATAAEAKLLVQPIVQRPTHQFDVAVERSVKTVVEVGSHYSSPSPSSNGGSVLSLKGAKHSTVPKLEVLNDMSVPQHVFRHGEVLRVFGWEQFGSMPQLEVADLITMAPISAEELRKDEAWWEIYETSFPDSERESREQILREAESEGRTYAVKLNGSTVGLTVIHFLREVRCAFLVYVAVSSHLRSLSLGSKLLKFVFADCERYYLEQGGGPALGVVLELEVLDEGESEEDNAMRLRRTRFYERLGAVLFTGPYMQPPVNGPPVPLSLMFRPNPGVELPSPSDMRQLMRCMFVEKYVNTSGVPIEDVQPMIEKFCQEPGSGEWVPAH
eukprot:TRINITY_DN2870_c0_g1_i1.p1 TRINITY_DN2870_c0_g1~~TRINITY_DN2870_c0_g1_i1.p1  ORF type:complete len:565 (+),score=93.17 TRINITY_DN2870_c0_g1_i1:68-1762(+)